MQEVYIYIYIYCRGYGRNNFVPSYMWGILKGFSENAEVIFLEWRETWGFHIHDNRFS